MEEMKSERRDTSRRHIVPTRLSSGKRTLDGSSAMANPECKQSSQFEFLVQTMQIIAYVDG